MSTEFYNRNWRMPKSSNISKLSNYSMSFDGSSELVDIGNDINFEYNDAFSYSFWVNPSSISGVKYLFSKYASSRGILIYLNSSSASGNNSLEFNLYNKASGSPSTRKQINTNSSSMALPNEWTNIVITYDGSGLGSGVNFYKNGLIQTVNVTQDTLAGNTILTSQDAYIGGNNFASSFFSGKLDHFAIFDYALSSSQVTSLYGNSTNGVGDPMSLSTKPVAYYKIGDKAAFNGSEYLVTNAASEVYSPYALDFDAINDCINISSTINLPLSSCFSLWFNNTGVGSMAYGGTLICSPYIYQSGRNNTFAVALRNTNVLTLESYNETSGTFTNPIDSTTITNGVWNNLTGVLSYTDASDSSIQFYLNGSSFGSAINLSGRNLNGLTNGLILGAYDLAGTGVGNFYFYNGQLSNVSIWNVALTSSQVTELYNSGKPGNLNNHSAYSNLVSWWQLGENSSFDGTNWTVLNEISSGPNGVSANMTEADLVNGVGTTGNGLSDGMGGADNIIGDAPYSTANAVSYGMGVDALSTDVPS